MEIKAGHPFGALLMVLEVQVSPRDEFQKYLTILNFSPIEPMVQRYGPSYVFADSEEVAYEDQIMLHQVTYS